MNSTHGEELLQTTEEQDRMDEADDTGEMEENTVPTPTASIDKTDETHQDGREQRILSHDHNTSQQSTGFAKLTSQKQQMPLPSEPLRKDVSNYIENKRNASMMDVDDPVKSAVLNDVITETVEVAIPATISQKLSAAKELKDEKKTTTGQSKAAESVDVKLTGDKFHTLVEPLEIHPIMLLSIGTLEGLSEAELKGFHSHRYIYPIGFRTKKLFSGLENVYERETFVSTIADGGGKPLFKILDQKGTCVAESGSTSGAWMKLIERINSKRDVLGVQRLGERTSGPLQYGLTLPLVTKLIAKYCTGSDRCTAYVSANHFLSTGSNLKNQPAAGKRGSISKSTESSSDKVLHSLSAPKHRFKVDDLVEGRFQRGEQWYPGRIAVVHENDRYDIMYEDGDYEANIFGKFVRPMPEERKRLFIKGHSSKMQVGNVENGAGSTQNRRRRKTKSRDKRRERRSISKPLFQAKERVEALWKKGDEWFVGTIGAVHKEDATCYYTLLYDDGEEEMNVSESHIRKLEGAAKEAEEARRRKRRRTITADEMSAREAKKNKVKGPALLGIRQQRAIHELTDMREALTIAVFLKQCGDALSMYVSSSSSCFLYPCLCF